MKGDGGAIGNESDSEGQGLLLLLSLHIKRIQKVSYCLFFFSKIPLTELAYPYS